MTDPTEAIREALTELEVGVKIPMAWDIAQHFHKAARNLSYALKAMASEKCPRCDGFGGVMPGMICDVCNGTGKRKYRAPEVKADPLREALEQIRTVCEDNSPNSCDQRMALNFVWQIAAANLAASGLPAPQPPIPITTEHREAIARIIEEKMADVWNDICSDTHCHPLDIEQIGRGPDLIFKPNHWSRQTAQTAATAILALSPPVITDRAAVIEACAKIADQFQSEADCRGQELSYGALYGEQCASDAAASIAIAIRALVDAKEEKTNSSC